jgi:hypothetical protein
MPTPNAPRPTSPAQTGSSFLNWLNERATQGLNALGQRFAPQMFRAVSQTPMGRPAWDDPVHYPMNYFNDALTYAGYMLPAALSELDPRTRETNPFKLAQSDGDPVQTFIGNEKYPEHYRNVVAPLAGGMLLDPEIAVGALGAARPFAKSYWSQVADPNLYWLHPDDVYQTLNDIYQNSHDLTAQARAGDILAHRTPQELADFINSLDPGFNEFSLAGRGAYSAAFDLGPGTNVGETIVKFGAPETSGQLDLVPQSPYVLQPYRAELPVPDFQQSLYPRAYTDANASTIGISPQRLHDDLRWLKESLVRDHNLLWTDDHPGNIGYLPTSRGGYSPYVIDAGHLYSFPDVNHFTWQWEDPWVRQLTPVRDFLAQQGIYAGP